MSKRPPAWGAPSSAGGRRVAPLTTAEAWRPHAAWCPRSHAGRRRGQADGSDGCLTAGTKKRLKDKECPLSPQRRPRRAAQHQGHGGLRAGWPASPPCSANHGALGTPRRTFQSQTRQTTPAETTRPGLEALRDLKAVGSGCTGQRSGSGRVCGEPRSCRRQRGLSATCCSRSNRLCPHWQVSESLGRPSAPRSDRLHPNGASLTLTPGRAAFRWSRHPEETKPHRLSPSVLLWAWSPPSFPPLALSRSFVS